MRFIWMGLSFLLGVFAAKNLFHFEHSGEGDSKFNFYIVFGFINHIPAKFEDTTHFVEEDEDEDD